MRIVFLFLVQAAVLTASANQLQQEGKILYERRCAICHGVDARGTGPLAHKSKPPANDLTSPKFEERLKKYPGVIVASVVLMPNGTLIPDTLKKNGVTLSKKDWRASELRALNEYLLRLIKKAAD